MIQVYRQGNAQFKLDSRNPLNWRCVTKAQLERKAMEQDAVAVTLISVSPCTFEYRDYIIVDGRPYFLNVIPKVTKEGKRAFTTELNFEGGMFELGRVAFTMAGLRGWDYIGRLDDFCRLVVNEMNRNSLVGTMQGHLMRSTGRIVQGKYEWKDTTLSNTHYYSQSQIPANGDMLYTLNDLPHATISNVGGGWTLDFEQEWNGKEYVDVPTDEKMLTHDNHTCLAVMHDLVSQWEDWEFAVDVRTDDLCNIDSSVPTQCGGNIIVRRKATGIYISGVNTNHLNMAYGKKGGLEKITRESEDGQNLPSRIYFYGGTQNLPTTYRNTRLCLPLASKEKSYIDTGFSDNEPCEAVKIFDDIYPACEPFTIEAGVGMTPVMVGDSRFCFSLYKDNFFNIYARWHDPTDPSPYAYGSYAEWLLFYGTGDSETDLQRYKLYYYEGDTSQVEQQDFPKSCYLLGEDVIITFQTGNLAGHSFKLADFDILNENNEYEITLACERIESLYPDELEQFFPNGDIMCSAGDRFIVEGCLMPASFVYANFGSGEYAAETLLEREADNYINELASKIKVGVEISQDFIDGHGAVFRLYDGLQISDSDLGFSSVTYKVRKVVYDLLKNSYKVEIDDGKGRSLWASIVQYVRRLSKR